MSVTVLIDQKGARVSYVEWRRERYTIAYPVKATIDLPLSAFRENEYEIVHECISKYPSEFIEPKVAKELFEDAESTKFLKRHVAIEISQFDAKSPLIFCPLRFRSYSLGGLRDLGKEYHKKLAPGYTREQFWQAFDEALLDAG